MKSPHIVIVGAGINGLVAANYLRRSGCRVTVLERSWRVGGACVSAEATIGQATQSYALGASVLGLMQDYVYQETGLADRLTTFVPQHPKLVYFPGDETPTRIFRDPAKLDHEMAERWGEAGDVEAFREDEAKVVRFLQAGYRQAVPPSLADAVAELGTTLTNLWISGTARNLLNHYLTSERSKIYMAMTITESGPVSLDDPYSAFTLPLMDSGSIFGGYYGFVKGGIWQITEELGRINDALGVVTHLDASVSEVDRRGHLSVDIGATRKRLDYDYLILATDPLTAARLVGTPEEQERTGELRFRGSSGKLNLMFKKPVRWKHGSNASDSNAAFRFIFSVSDIDAFEAETLRVMDPGINYAPGYAQIYCEGAAMRQMSANESFDRLAVFFKNLSLNRRGEELDEVANTVRETVLEKIENPEDCAWHRLLMPKDLQQLFLFPGGNLDHTMLVGGQTFFERNFSADPSVGFYQFGSLENVYLCGSGTYPCGSVTGTAGYMCSQQLLRSLGIER